ncbi:NAD-dependent SIR2 family protein deacetylase [Pseudomonas duriflava]|uniref:NAD-dependent protein deacetylase n=1 Tax=Pseudomonas duriflava TaxID=459528 RepID=A0A562QG08_9PSED|nr:NAD-dependent protein deacetylase [Pseudomonas duriflava]TWI54966.1 NAD-dependent SIR2 family protein deacetylase [Pseudomonas duriflava]
MLDVTSESPLTELLNIVKSRTVLVITGAGISTASGIPDYRDANGVRRGRAPMMHQEFVSSAQARRRYWARSMRGWPTVRQAQPNAAHHALAHLEAKHRISRLITQNVDALHEQAGSHRVIELHGNLHRVVCLDCGKCQRREDIQAILESENAYLQEADIILAPDGDAQLAEHYLNAFRMPACPCCGSEMLKPDVVFFGDGVPTHQADAATRSVQEAEALLVIGTSLMTYSSFRLCQQAHREGKPIMAINLGKTRADALLTLKVESHCEDVLPRVVEQWVNA